MLIADFKTKPLQGKKLKVFRNLLLNLKEPIVENHVQAETDIHKSSITAKPHTDNDVKVIDESKECVGLNKYESYKSVIRRD